MRAVEILERLQSGEFSIDDLPEFVNELKAMGIRVVPIDLDEISREVRESYGWVECVSWGHSASDHMRVQIWHSYPEGIDVTADIRRFITERLPDHMTLESEFCRLSPDELSAFREQLRREQEGCARCGRCARGDRHDS